MSVKAADGFSASCITKSHHTWRKRDENGYRSKYSLHGEARSRSSRAIWLRPLLQSPIYEPFRRLLWYSHTCPRIALLLQNFLAVHFSPVSVLVIAQSSCPLQTRFVVQDGRAGRALFCKKSFKSEALSPTYLRREGPEEVGRQQSLSGVCSQ